MGILENLRYGKKARELGLTVEQYLRYQQVRETDDVTLGEYKRYLNDYAERMSWRADSAAGGLRKSRGAQAA